MSLRSSRLKSCPDTKPFYCEELEAQEALKTQRSCASIVKDFLNSHILSGFEHAGGDLLLQGNHVDGLELHQATDDRDLGAHHIAFGHGRDHLLGRCFETGHRTRDVDLGHPGHESALL